MILLVHSKRTSQRFAALYVDTNLIAKGQGDEQARTVEHLTQELANQNEGRVFLLNVSQYDFPLETKALWIAVEQYALDKDTLNGFRNSKTQRRPTLDETQIFEASAVYEYALSLDAKTTYGRIIASGINEDSFLTLGHRYEQLQDAEFSLFHQLKSDLLSEVHSEPA